ncbi:Fungal lipase-like domain [Trypanosoma melophagium]|uniref:Fungal lipase-like domain n=1 Tax=Trypanosoma melophagium TaxID=715481 RepID=UPI00351A7CF4|nr:Fungal lipase-like domain [Trypanosoma melophagium]
MSVSRAVRRDTCAAYRRLLGAVHQVGRDCPLNQTEGLTRYVAARFFGAAEENRRRYLKLRERKATPRGRRGQQQQQKALEFQYERYIAKELQKVHNMTEQVLLAPGNRALTSMLQVLSAGVGNIHYQQMIEGNYFQYSQFEVKKAERNEVDEEAVAERQNRIMQHALIPYGERLAFLHRLERKDGSDKIQENKKEQELKQNTLTSWQVTESIVGTRNGVTAHHVSHGKEDMVLEVDETYNKQIVYLRCEPYDWEQEVERLEITEAEEVRGTVFHAEYLSIAQRLVDALLAETPLHAYRSTVVVGHGVGGAVGFCLALLLHVRGFDVKNCVSFGSPKSVQRTLERYIHYINPIRVVLEGDPLVELPVTGSEGDPFVHYGEILIMGSPASQQEEEREKVNRQEKEKGEEQYDTRNISSSNDSLTADALSDLLETDVPLVTQGSGEGKKYMEDNDNDEDTEETAEDISRLSQITAKRYSVNYTADHYIDRLVDTTVPLTYAEGDEVWDEGDYTQMRREAGQKPHVMESQKWREETKSPL